jgi:hypothetical protein
MAGATHLRWIARHAAAVMVLSATGSAAQAVRAQYETCAVASNCMFVARLLLFFAEHHAIMHYASKSDDIVASSSHAFPSHTAPYIARARTSLLGVFTCERKSVRLCSGEQRRSSWSLHNGRSQRLRE